MKLLEIEELSPDGITEQVKKSRLELVELRMKLTSRQLENPSLIRKKRKEIARLLTVYTRKLASGEVDKKIEKKVVKEEKLVKAKKEPEKKTKISKKGNK